MIEETQPNEGKNRLVVELLFHSGFRMILRNPHSQPQQLRTKQLPERPNTSFLVRWTKTQVQFFQEGGAVVHKRSSQDDFARG